MKSRLVVIKGGGEMASGVGHKLSNAGFDLLILELPEPLVVRRFVSFAQAVYTKSHQVEGIYAERISSLAECPRLWEQAKVPVYCGEYTSKDLLALDPLALVDATMRKYDPLTTINDAPLVIGLGPGFCARKHAHAVVETNRGHNLGRVYYEGMAEPDTKTPGEIGGYTTERVLRAPVSGVFCSNKEIGDKVVVNELIATVDGVPITAPINGVLRGLIHGEIEVTVGTKVGDIDPRNISAYCYTISDKARTIAGGVLEVLCHLGGYNK